MKIKSFFYYLNYFFKASTLKTVVNSVQWYLEDNIINYSKISKHKSTFIHPSVNVKSPENILIGKETRIQPHVFLWASPNSKIIVGDFSGIGPQTMLFSSNHQYEFGKTYIKQPWVEKDINIGKNVWVGAGCVITSGVTIGDGAVIGAGSVVTRDVPPNSLVAGVPAKILKDGNALNEK